jgi:predicted O-methyltransferase YrrM
MASNIKRKASTAQAIIRRQAAIPLAAVIDRRDVRRLATTAPGIVPTPAQLESIKSELLDAYRRYTTDVSPANMAASFEAACMLLFLCRAQNASEVLDTGSGFSSFVLRTHARTSEHDVNVVSVDDDPVWLDRTREFLDGFDLPTGELLLWDDFLGRTPGNYDIAFHDLAGGELRETAMPRVVENVKPQGLIVFDDAQHPGHRRAMRLVTKNVRGSLFSIRRWTLDDVGRYEMLGITTAASSDAITK